MLIPASAASAYTHTNCSWSTGGTGNVTWQNNIGSVHSDTAIAAASSWASYTDVNDMSPSGGTMVATAPNDGPNGYHGWTSWNCGTGNRTWSASVTVNRHYVDDFFNNKVKAIWVHEFGHALGLNHSVEGTIMFSCAACSFNDYQLWWPAPDDVAGINALY